MTALSDRILELRRQGKTYNEIKELTGASKGTISYWVGESQRDKTVTRQRNRRRTISDTFQKIKQESPCADCGENYPYWIMDFDHLGDKEFQISSYRKHGKNLEDILREIAKCDVVCSNCHRNRTHARKVYSETNSQFNDVSAYYE
jgi:hypothetical protein